MSEILDRRAKSGDQKSMPLFAKENDRNSFILVINQLDEQNLFYNKFISCLYMFRAPRAHRQEVKNCTGWRGAD